MSVNVGTVERGRFADLVRPSYLAWTGIGLGVVAFWLTLPPVTARSPLVPLAVGALGVGAGLWSRRLGASRRLAWGAVAAAILGIGLGWLATRSEVTSLEQAFVWSALIAATFRAATPLTFAALGGIFSERSGVVNIGLEGMLLMGAFFGFLGADKLGEWWWGILAGIVAGAALALVHAFISIHLRADQIVSGTAVNFLALGVTGYFFIEVYTDQGTPGDVSSIPSVSLGWLGIPDGSFVDKAFGDWHLLIWVALASSSSRTSSSSARRSAFVCARSASIRRLPTPSASPCTASATARSSSPARSPASAASTSRTASRTGSSENMTAGRGFIALAAVIFGRWRPFGAFAACLLFGFTEALALRLPGAYGSDAAWTTLFRALPYVVTLVVVAGVVGRSIPPAAVGRPYVKQ